MGIGLKPNKFAFILSGITKRIIIFFIIIIGINIALKFLLPEFSIILISFLALIFISLFFYFERNIVYKKTNYLINNDRIIYKTGGIFSDHETELIIKNVTHVVTRLPFIENKIFDTGHINIEAAGSKESEIHFCSMDKTTELNKLVTEIMQKNGFNLEVGELVQEEKPNGLGVFFEVFKNFITALFIIFIILGDLTSKEEGLKEMLLANLNIVIPLLLLAVFIIIISQIFTFLDLKKRIYSIYENLITYKEGFLSKNYAIIPFKNLTDTSTTQTFVDKIFGLNDVKVSCQGSGNEILFKNLTNGQAMSDTLDKLINLSKAVKEGILAAVSSDEQKYKDDGGSESSVDFNSEFTGEYTINAKRELFPSIIISIGAFILSLPFMFVLGFKFSIMFTGALFALGIAGVFVVFSLIKIKSTRYLVNKNNVEYYYTFLTSRKVEFSNEMVTGVTIKQNFIDVWFNTISINFWSIGASDNLTFSNIKKEDAIIANILSKFGIKKEEEIYRINSNFNFGELLRANFFMITTVSLLVVGVFISLFYVVGLWASLAPFILILLFIPKYIYQIYFYKKSSAVFCKNFIYFQKGIFFRKFYYVLYNNIKDITTIRYPFSNEGSICFNVAGERITSASGKVVPIRAGSINLFQILNRRGQHQVASNGFTIEYVNQITIKDELIDYVLHKRPGQLEVIDIEKNGLRDVGAESEKITKPSLKNELGPIIAVLIVIDLFSLLFISVFSSFIIWLLIFTLINATLIIPKLLIVKAKTYIIDNYRVLAKSGVFYKKQISIIFNKIDFINKNQAFLNKIFKTGNITVNTVGSSRPEIIIENIPDYEDFYSSLKEIY